MTTTPLTMAEYEEAVANGDTICQCGYRKSQHGPNHPPQDLFPGQQEVVQAWIGGRRGAKKDEIHAEMWKIIPEFRTNEHVRDAIAIGLTYVARRGLERKVAAWRERNPSKVKVI